MIIIMKIQAAVLKEMGAPRPYADSRPLSIETLELAPPGYGEVLVRIRAAGLCHSDLSVINGSRPRPTPMALGHEAAGEVVELGPGVTDLAVGDHVVMVFVPSCGHCVPCAEGRPALCEPGNAANGRGEMLAGGRRLSADGHAVNHHLGVSAFADYAVLSRNSLVPIPKDVPFEHAALFGCAVLTGVGAVANTAHIRLGETVAVIGLGGVGMNALLAAVASGAGRIVAIDTLPKKLETAREWGATDVFNALDDDCAEQVLAATEGGVNHAIELAGSEQAMQLAYRITRRGGNTITGGLAHPDKHFSTPQFSIVAEERRVLGSYVGSCVPVRDIPRYVQLYRQGRLPVDRLLSGVLPLSEINEAFDRLDRGEVLRQVVVFN